MLKVGSASLDFHGLETVGFGGRTGTEVLSIQFNDALINVSDPTDRVRLFLSKNKGKRSNHDHIRGFLLISNAHTEGSDEHVDADLRTSLQSPLAAWRASRRDPYARAAEP